MAARPVPFGKTEPRHVLVGVDFSESSVRALQTALTYVRPSDIVTVFSVPTPPPIDQRRDGAFGSAVVESYIQTRERMKLKLGEMVESAACKVRWAEGDAAKGPRQELVRVAQDHQVDLVVVGSRNLRSWEKLLLGSVSDYVRNNVKCPVMIVP